jgi:hypothetical protein
VTAHDALHLAWPFAALIGLLVFLWRGNRR